MEMTCEREAVEIEHEEDSIQTIVFTAGTILIMLGLKRFLVEQWRPWVFLILNLILLAILFMSMKPSCWVMSKGREGEGQEGKIGKTKKKSAFGCPQEAEEEGEKESYKEHYRRIDVSIEENDKEEEKEEEEEEDEEVSKEELNERVEAFIAMFRQHLVSDAKQAENFRFQKHSGITTREFNYSSVLLQRLS